MRCRLLCFLLMFFSFFIAVQARASDVLQFNDSRSGPISVVVFDWLPANGLAVGAVPMAVSPSTSNFNLLMHTSLGNFMDGNSQPIQGTGLHADYELTVVMGATQQGSVTSVTTQPFTTLYSLRGSGPTNFFRVYYDTSKNSNVLAGTGFNDGILILSGTFTQSSGIYTVPNTNTSPLDQFITNNYSGITTLSGIGSFASDVRIDYYNPQYISFASPNPSLSFNTTTNAITPFSQTDPSAQFFNGTGFQNPVRGAGNVNGMPATQGQADFQFQTDPNTAFFVCGGTIGDIVWHDLNKNGIQDAGEPGIDKVTVSLQNSSGTTIATATTGLGPSNQHGYYQFTGLCAGDYKVVVDESTLPAGFTPTTSNVGSDRTIDSNGSPALVTLPTDSSSDQTIDFGYVSPCTGSIGDFVWLDMNRDGIQNDGPTAGINGVTITK